MAKKNVIHAIDIDFLVWGINSNMEDYRLCWQLNRILGWQLKRIADVQLEKERTVRKKKTKEYSHFNAYEYQHLIDRYTVELIQNKNGRRVFIPEMKNFDFLFLFQGEDDYFDPEQFAELLTRIPGIQSVIPVDVQSLPSRNNLLLRHLHE